MGHIVSHPAPERRRRLAGLGNKDNRCYMNSVLQVLSQNDKFVAWALTFTDRTCRLAYAVVTLVLRLHRTGAPYIWATEVKEILGERYPEYLRSDAQVRVLF